MIRKQHHSRHRVGKIDDNIKFCYVCTPYSVLTGHRNECVTTYCIYFVYFRVAHTLYVITDLVFYNLNDLNGRELTLNDPQLTLPDRYLRKTMPGFPLHRTDI